MRISLAKREESIYGLAARTVIVCITAQAGRRVTRHAACLSSAMVGYVTHTLNSGLSNLVLRH
jgi:hypothetical protein